ncbi:MAG: YkoF family thiamine/hydroxymethylpyrimidine-binding protein [Gammaproteobacteria bacterium]
MRITVEMSLYPLAPDFVGHITDFIVELRREPGLEIVTNQMSTQVRGEFDAVLGAVGRCTRAAMERVHPVVLVAKFLNADLPIATTPGVGAATAATGRA